MSTATVDQMGRDFSAWLAAVQRGETVAIVDAGREVARLVPPAHPQADTAGTSRSMSEWLAAQDQRMQRTFGNRTVVDSAAVLNDLRTDRA